jgi:hypothetical protein
MSSPEPQPERHEWTLDQVWAALMLCRDADTCSSALGYRPIRAGNLDPFYLRRARRRVGLPDLNEFLIVTPEMLDAIVEAGPVGSPEGLVRVDGMLW